LGSFSCNKEFSITKRGKSIIKRDIKRLVSMGARQSWVLLGGGHITVFIPINSRDIGESFLMTQRIKKMSGNSEELRECLGVVLYNLAEVAGILKLSERTVYQYIKDGKLKAQKIGTHWKISEGNLKAFLNGER
jgi:excisionase family DNA binding protein